MDSQKIRRPISLTVVAILFVIGGIDAAIDVIISAMNSFFKIHFGVLGIFIGAGLLNLRPGWRTCALVFGWIGLILTPIVGVIFAIGGGPLDLTFFGQKIGECPVIIGIGACLLAFLLLIWIYSVLTRPDVRELFCLEAGNGSDATA